MSKITNGLIIGLVAGAVLVFAFGSLYLRDQTKSLLEEYQTDSQKNEDNFLGQIENINQLLNNSR